MNCPACGSGEGIVLTTRTSERLVRRTRQCSRCGKRWATVEAPLEVHEAATTIRERFAALAAAVGPIPGEG